MFFFNIGYKRPIRLGILSKSLKLILEFDFNLKTNSSNSILIFDSVPFRNSFFSIRNNYECSYFDNKIIEFLEDINKLDKNNTLYLKIKRDYNNKIYSKKYKKFVEQSNFILLDKQNLKTSFDPIVLN